MRTLRYIRQAHSCTTTRGFPPHINTYPRVTGTPATVRDSMCWCHARLFYSHGTGWLHISISDELFRVHHAARGFKVGQLFVTNPHVPYSLTLTGLWVNVWGRESERTAGLSIPKGWKQKDQAAESEANDWSKVPTVRTFSTIQARGDLQEGLANICVVLSSF